MNKLAVAIAGIVLVILAIAAGDILSNGPSPRLVRPVPRFLSGNAGIGYPQYQTPIVTDVSVPNAWVVGDVLSTTNGTWLNSPSQFSYQWQDCDALGASCSNIGGAIASTYTLLGGDVGHTIRSVVTATNSGGSTAVNSGPTGSVSSGGGGNLSCDLNATTSNFTTQIAAATAGQVVCLASGDYSSFTGTNKSVPGVTITSQPSAAVTFNSGMNLNPSTGIQNFSLDGTGGGGTMTVKGDLNIETTGDAQLNKALNLTFQNVMFLAGGWVTFQGPENSNVTFNRDGFEDISSNCISGGSSGIHQIWNVQTTATTTTPTGLTIENSVFVAPMDLWNPSSAIQTAAPMTTIGNAFYGYVDHTEAASCTHIDTEQDFAGINSHSSSGTFSGNLCVDVYGCYMAFDGTSVNTIEDNVCFDTSTFCVSLFSDVPGSTVNHNTQQTNGADPGSCNSMHEPQAPIQACSNATVFGNSTKSGDTPTSGETVTNNIGPLALDSGSTSTNSNNMFPGASSPNINGTKGTNYNFAGGTNPITWTGFFLTAGSTGQNAGLDGLDVGIRASANSPPTGGGSAAVNTVTPSLSGTATSGSTLTTTDGTWTVTGGVPTLTTYQWFDCTTNSFSVSATTCTPIEPITSVTSGSSGVHTNTFAGAGTLNVLSTTGFANTGTLSLDSDTITYTGISGTTFTGCTLTSGADKILATSDAVIPSPYPTSNTASYKLTSANVGDFVFTMVTKSNANGQINAVSNSIGPVS